MQIKQRKINRLKDFDYSQAGYYFVTICVYNREDCLGKIINGEMVLNEYGKIVNGRWIWLRNQYSYVTLDEYVVMPNHFHGIIGIDVGNGRDRSLHKIKPLPELIGAFKTTSSKLIHMAGFMDFRWQKSFHDHIIRDGISLNKIREYIIYNPAQWDTDVENPKNTIISNQKEHINVINITNRRI